MLEDYFFTKNTKWFLWGFCALIVALLIFHAGVVVGSHEPERGRMPDRTQVGTPGMLGGFMPTEGYLENGHGAVGTITALALPSFSLETRDGMVQKIYAGTSTVITGGTLTSGETVIVVGEPEGSDDQGYLDARIVHILPAPPAPMPQASSSAY